MLRGWRFDRALSALGQSNEAVIRAYGSAAWPGRGTPAANAPYLALDFELDGLRKEADLLQAGWVPFEGHSLTLAEARSLDIRSKARLDDLAVTIHGIGEQRAAAGLPIEEVLRALIEGLSGRILVAHAASIEKDALQRTVKAVFGAKLPIRAICTLALERQLNPNLVGREAYRLGPTRARYGLPAYPVHDALTDAIAAAELFQAQLSRLPDDVTIGRLERG